MSAPPRPGGAAPDEPVGMPAARMATDSPSATIVKRSVAIAGHRTSISLEAPFWEALRQIAAARGLPLQRLVAEIDAARGPANLSSAIRVHVLAAARDGMLPRPAEEGGASD